MTADSKCGAPKAQGSETILCGREPDHEKDDGSWHEAVVTDHRQMDFGTSRIKVETREVIQWEPFSRALDRVVSRYGTSAP